MIFKIFFFTKNKQSINKKMFEISFFISFLKYKNETSLRKKDFHLLENEINKNNKSKIELAQWARNFFFIFSCLNE